MILVELIEPELAAIGVVLPPLDVIVLYDGILEVYLEEEEGLSSHEESNDIVVCLKLDPKPDLIPSPRLATLSRANLTPMR